ncbi:MAG: TrkA-N domain-containing protein [Bacteroidetes bacterium]|nr:MAG: TrkA-N domain-containing protein [Bacteroidota bacterium]
MKRQPITFRDKLRYRFENTLSAGPIAVIGWLAVLSLLIIVIAAGIVAIAGVSMDNNDTETGFVEAAWRSMMRAMDAGNVAGDGPGWGIRMLMLTVTIGGIFIVSTLIGTITSGMESKIEEMRKGRSKVIEHNHTLILGWSAKIFSIVSELAIANASERKPRIVIMADMDKVEMEDEIRAKISDLKNMRVICRTGSPLDLDDLEVVNLHESKAVIILSPESENPDTHVIKSILAITNNPNRRKESYHIVAEIREEQNMEAAELVSNDEAVLVLAGDLIARVTAQTCRQSGLSVVYTELLDFDGVEIYFKQEPEVVGQAFRFAMSSFQTSCLIGVMTKDERVLLNAPMEHIIEESDRLIFIAEDNTSIKTGRHGHAPDMDAIRHDVSPPPGKERTLIIGWNKKGRNIIRELDGYVGEGSEVVVLCSEEGTKSEIDELAKNLNRQSLKFVTGNTTDRATLEQIDTPSFNHIIVLCYSSLPMQEADAKTLITLLHLRNLSEKAGRDFSIVSEMLDMRNRALAEVAKADDFIVSDKLISLMLSQVSENKHLDKVFKDLFSPEGSEIYLKPVKDYVLTTRAVNFYTLVEAAADRGQTAIGYRIQANASDPDKAYGVVVNPDKNQKVTFSPEDKIIVLAED